MDMSFKGDFEVGMRRDQAFALLADPQKFVPVLPTFHSMQMKENDASTAVVKIKVGIGKVHGIATTEMSLTECESPVRARYVGKGSVMGSAYNMIVGFTLEDSAGGGTRVNWDGCTQIHGKILSIAGGGMRGYADKEIRKVIDSLQGALVSVEHFESVVGEVLGPILLAAHELAAMRAAASRAESEAGDCAADGEGRGLVMLTPAELKVAWLAASGLPYKLIADRLNKSFSTVDHQLRSIRQKLRVRTYAELAAVLANSGGPSARHEPL